MTQTHVTELLAVLAVVDHRLRQLRDPELLRRMSAGAIAAKLDDAATRLEQMAQELRGAVEKVTQ